MMSRRHLPLNREKRHGLFPPPNIKTKYRKNDDQFKLTRAINKIAVSGSLIPTWC